MNVSILLAQNICDYDIKSLMIYIIQEMEVDEASVQSQREFVTSALLGRLNDDDPSVVLAVLNLKAKVCDCLGFFFLLLAGFMLMLMR